jgi:hypothetical protein
MSVQSAIANVVTVLNIEVMSDKDNVTEMNRDQPSTLTKLYTLVAASYSLWSLIGIGRRLTLTLLMSYIYMELLVKPEI